MDNKGISGIVATVIMIALVIAIGGIVWAVINNLVSEQLEEAGSCFGVFEKVTINEEYTCWNSSDNLALFSISIGDLDVDGIVVSISAGGTTKSYEIGKQPSDIGLYYFHNSETSVASPGKNSGFTYVSDEFTVRPDVIQVSPIIGGSQCDVADSVTSIDTCFL